MSYIWFQKQVSNEMQIPNYNSTLFLHYINYSSFINKIQLLRNLPHVSQENQY